MMSSTDTESTRGLMGPNMTANGTRERDQAMENVNTPMEVCMKESSSIILNTAKGSLNIEMTASMLVLGLTI